MRTEDLYLKYAEVINMCEGTKVKPWEGVRQPETKALHRANKHPDFTMNPEYYEFMVGVLEDKPVFVGDAIYHKVGWIPYKVGYGDSNFSNGAWSWETGASTLPCPQKDWTPFNLDLNTWRPDGRLSGMRYYFKNEGDVVKAASLLRKLLEDATK